MEAGGVVEWRAWPNEYSRRSPLVRKTDVFHMLEAYTRHQLGVGNKRATRSTGCRRGR